MLLFMQQTMRPTMRVNSSLLVKGDNITYANMSIKLVSRYFYQALCLLACVAIVFFICLQIKKVNAQELTSNAASKVILETKHEKKQTLERYPRKLSEHLSEKFYRQALYFYFQNQPELALRQLYINDEYFSKTPIHTSLFKAGLQISQGLHQEAQKLLTDLSINLSGDAELTNQVSQVKSRFIEENSDSDRIKSNLQKEELMIIIFLQLAQQKIDQQESKAAKKFLNNIYFIPTKYLTQYYLLQQLIAWPQQPNINNLPLAPTSKKQLTALLNNNTQAPYLILNEALSAMSQQEYVLAEKKLEVLQNFRQQKKPNSFWLQLFSNVFSQKNYSPNSDLQKPSSTPDTIEQLEQQIEQNGINHYAQLLYAQLYIEQGLFQQAYDQLNSFPKHTAFSEQALFLFGYSAFKLNKFSNSEAILNTLITDYPYSTFTQQAWALSAEQYIVQNNNHVALDRYLQIEKYYQNKQQELTAFKNTLNTEDDLLNFYQIHNIKDLKLKKDASKHEIWLKASLQHAQVSTAYQQLLSVDVLTKQIEIQQNKSAWLANTIALNNTRQKKIRTSQSQVNYVDLLQQLTDKKAQLSTLLANAKVKVEVKAKVKKKDQKTKSSHGNNSGVINLGDEKLFANKIERKWLSRIDNSKSSLAFLQKSKANATTDIDDYQQRLARVQGVLTWQLQQKFPERFWQSQQSLNEFEKLHRKTMQQYKRVDGLLSQKNVIKDLSSKHLLLANNITSLLVKTQQLKRRLNKVLLAQNQLFIENEQRKIQQFLLFNQRAMASVIESLNQQEAF